MREKAAGVNISENNCICFHRLPPKFNLANNKRAQDGNHAQPVSREIKKTSADQGRRLTPWYHPACLTKSGSIQFSETALDRDNGRFPLLVIMDPFNPMEVLIPVHQQCLPILAQQASSNLSWGSKDPSLGSHLSLPARCWMSYYSCQTIYSVVNFTGKRYLNNKTSFEKEEWTQRDSNPRPPQCH